MPQMTLLIRGHFMRATAPQMTGFQGHPIQGPCHCSKSISRPKLTHAIHVEGFRTSAVIPAFRHATRLYSL
ncbi:hypothetical protein CEP54_009889 [Fusarium duplospermum]|uniref:Uncharacterized protein n=1 Tax=Fusarium duplospermum TaxID=1325734 RepID=A0A428PN35_9HYPO|nr:hypothetical protein CEP54_009889 [Fusarium duplospermum]